MERRRLGQGSLLGRRRSSTPDICLLDLSPQAATAHERSPVVVATGVGDLKNHRIGVVSPDDTRHRGNWLFLRLPRIVWIFRNTGSRHRRQFIVGHPACEHIGRHVGRIPSTCKCWTAYRFEII